MKHMTSMVFSERTLDEFLGLREGGVLAELQSSDLVVISLELRGADLTSLVCIAPKGYAFGQEYWLGESYLRWHQIFGLHRENFDSVAASVRRMGLALEDVPYAIVNFGTGEFANAMAKRIDWDRNVFQTFVVPTKAVSAAHAALEASVDLVRGFLYEQNANRAGVEARYGEVPLEKVFSRKVYGYRRPAKASKATAYVGLTAEHLHAVLADVRRMASQLDASTLDRTTNWRWLTYRPLDCRDFGRGQEELVAEVNLEMAHLLESIQLPHFYYELLLRRVDTSLNRAQASYRLVRNDLDWAERLHDLSPKSFSPNFDERTMLLEYIGKIQNRYPFMARDPLRGAVPGVKLEA